MFSLTYSFEYFYYTLADSLLIPTSRTPEKTDKSSELHFSEKFKQRWEIDLKLAKAWQKSQFLSFFKVIKWEKILTTSNIPRKESDPSLFLKYKSKSLITVSKIYGFEDSKTEKTVKTFPVSFPHKIVR